VHLIDIWNVIEAFRENGLNTLEPTNEVSVARLETLISSLYHNLNKRLPSNQQVPVDAKAGLLLNWLLSAYTNNNAGIRVFSIKIALAIMCTGKMVDKLRCKINFTPTNLFHIKTTLYEYKHFSSYHNLDIFSQISDGAGQLIHWKGIDFLREILALPAAVYETPTFHYEDGLENEIFPIENKITVNDFIAMMVSEPGHPTFVWLSLLHRLATVENIVHPTICSSCQRENFSGFRYRCQHSKCHGYQLCQDCFWQGRVSQNHQNDHEVKEYSCFKSPSKQIGHSLRKSFRCVPEKPTTGSLPRFPDQPEKTLNLSHIVPPSPLPSHHNGFSDGYYDRSSTLDSRVTGRSLDSSTMLNTMSQHDMMQRTFNSNEDPHTMMARYAARLAKEQGKEGSSGSSINESTTQKTQRELISQLESKNKEIMREIQKLRQQEQEASNTDNPQLVHELRALRQRKGELEGHLGALQDSRRQLMQQLEGLMKLLKSHQAQSPRSTPNSSPRSAKSPPIPPQSK
jgi:hypothetical protein